MEKNSHAKSNRSSGSAKSSASGAKQEPKIVLEGRAPAVKPPRVLDYEELDKKSIDNLVDSLKYIATTSGIGIAMYSQGLREYVKLDSSAHRSTAKAILFAPLCFWFLTLICAVLGIFPRRRTAQTDGEKERAVLEVRKQKTKWSRLVLVSFLCGFAVLLYVMAAQIWNLYPFNQGPKTIQNDKQDPPTNGKNRQTSTLVVRNLRA
jgi:hypothetical protein